MEKRPFITVVGVFIALVLLVGTCSAGFVAGMAFAGNGAALVADLPVLQGIPGARPQSSGEEQAATPDELQTLFEPFWQAWNLVDKMYVDQPVDKTVMMRGAIEGMLESLGDQHSSYLDPDMFEMSQARLEGDEYEGIGAWVDVTKEFLTIISPMPESPAERAGLHPGDQIIAIDGEDMTGKDGEYARQHVLGPSGSTVTLTIHREGVEEPFDVKVERAAIVVPTVAGRMLEDENIAYVRIYTFGSDTAESLRETIRELQAENPDGLIVDMRYNGGGYLQTAIDVVSQFIDDGVVMYEEYGDGRRDTYEAQPGGVATDIPLVILVNEGSASASEIVAGAVQDRQRGYLVGVTTYGKGSVQNYAELVDKQGAVRVTVARWLTPNERQIHELGLNPDFPVEITEEDYTAGRDPQLDKAIEVLTQGLTPPPTAIPTVTPTPTAVP